MSGLRVDEMKRAKYPIRPCLGPDDVQRILAALNMLGGYRDERAPCAKLSAYLRALWEKRQGDCDALEQQRDWAKVQRQQRVGPNGWR